MLHCIKTLASMRTCTLFPIRAHLFSGLAIIVGVLCPINIGITSYLMLTMCACVYIPGGDSQLSLYQPSNDLTVAVMIGGWVHCED